MSTDECPYEPDEEGICKLCACDEREHGADDSAGHIVRRSPDKPCLVCEGRGDAALSSSQGDPGSRDRCGSCHGTGREPAPQSNRITLLGSLPPISGRLAQECGCQGRHLCSYHEGVNDAVQPCGHPVAAFVSSDEGTSYCRDCATQDWHSQYCPGCMCHLVDDIDELVDANRNLSDVIDEFRAENKRLRELLQAAHAFQTPHANNAVLWNEIAATLKGLPND